MKDVKIDGFIVVSGPDMSGCGRGGIVYEIFTTYAKFVRRLNEDNSEGRNNTVLLSYTDGRETIMLNCNLGKLSYFELPKKGLEGMKVRYPYSWGTVHVVRSWDIDRC